MSYFDDPRRRRSEELAFFAEREERNGVPGRARAMYEEAAALEEQVARDVKPDSPRTRGVLAISAVSTRTTSLRTGQRIST